MTRIDALLLLAVWPGLAVGQGSEDLLGACLAGADHPVAEADCIGVVQDACLDQSGDESTMGMAACLDEEIAAWEGQIDALWPQVVALAAEMDAEASSGTVHTDALMGAQESWRAFRDADCLWAWQRWSQGTIRVLIGGGCKRDMAAARVRDLRDWLRGGQ